VEAAAAQQQLEDLAGTVATLNGALTEAGTKAEYLQAAQVTTSRLASIGH
jgi:hypothetical protein